MYKHNSNKIDDNTIKYEFENPTNGKLTFAEFINLLKSENENFLKTFREALNNATKELSAYFWECIPVSQKTIDKNFEFVVTKSEALNEITQDFESFIEYLSKGGFNEGKIYSFPNRGKNAILVIPSLKIPADHSTPDYKNVSQFTKNAPLKQQSKFWQEVVNRLSEELGKNEDPKWLSTHGLGVHYLHVRINNSPKYYSWTEYKNEQTNEKQIRPSTDNNSKKENNNASSASPDGFFPGWENANNSTEINADDKEKNKNNSKLIIDSKRKTNYNTSSSSSRDVSPRDNNNSSLILVGLLIFLGIILIIFLTWKIKTK